MSNLPVITAVYAAIFGLFDAALTNDYTDGNHFRRRRDTVWHLGVGATPSGGLPRPREAIRRCERRILA